MRLTLKIENQDALANGQPLIQVLDRKGLQIGRAADVDWQLPDPQKLISSVHAEIRFRDGVFTLRDKSRNGTFLNGARVDSANREARINDGDRIAIGHYEISARIAGDDAQLVPIERGGEADNDGDVWGAADWGGVGAAPEPVAETDNRTPMNRGASAMDHAFTAPAAVSHAPAASAWDSWGSAAPAAPPVTAPARPAPAAAPMAAPAMAPAPAGFGADEASRALAAFLRGASLPPDVALDARAMEEAGRTFRVLVHGLFDLLKRQSEMKSVLGLERTVIRLADNNTLKFSASGDEALQRLMTPREGDLPGPAAGLRSFDDVRRHEERLLTAMNEAVKSIVERLSPQEIKRRETGGVMGKLIPNSSKASWWDELEREHARLLESDSAKLDELIEDELREAFGRHL